MSKLGQGVRINFFGLIPKLNECTLRIKELISKFAKRLPTSAYIIKEATKKSFFGIMTGGGREVKGRPLRKKKLFLNLKKERGGAGKALMARPFSLRLP